MEVLNCTFSSINNRERLNVRLTDLCEHHKTLTMLVLSRRYYVEGSSWSHISGGLDILLIEKLRLRWLYVASGINDMGFML